MNFYLKDFSSVRFFTCVKSAQYKNVSNIFISLFPVLGSQLIFNKYLLSNVRLLINPINVTSCSFFDLFLN